MRTVASFSLTADLSSKPDLEAIASFDTVAAEVSSWLQGKGATASQACETGGLFRLREGEVAELSVSRLAVGPDRLSNWELTQAHPAGEFRTVFAVARDAAGLTVFCTLEVGQKHTVIAPIGRLDVRTPEIIRRLVALPWGWRVGVTPATNCKERFIGQDGGRRLAVMVRDIARTLPLLVVSEDSGFLMHPGFDDDLARDAVGLARVASLDCDAAWELTRQLGQEWSCYNGAVRIYWPGAGPQSDPFAHWLWTAARMMALAPTTQEAARRFRDQLRWRLISVSAFSIRRPPVLDRVRIAASRQEYERLKQEARTLQDFVGLAESYAVHNTKLEEESRSLREEIARLQTDLENERLMRGYGEHPAGDLLPEQETPPATVDDALVRARKLFAADLVFGHDVDRGVRELARDAGPDKILHYLGKLAEASKALRANALGMPLHNWLQQQGVRNSGEGQTVRNSRDEQRKRTWAWDETGSSVKFFGYHLKPTDGTSPDRCARIYYEWDACRKKIVVGWIGRHPI